MKKKEVTAEAIKKKRLTVQQKFSLVTLLELPTANRVPETVSGIANRYGVSRKSLYAWQKMFLTSHYSLEVRNGFRCHQSKSSDPKLLEIIPKLVRQHPEWQIEQLKEELTEQGILLSSPTIRKTLSKLNLDEREKRYGAAEKAWINEEGERTDELYQCLIRSNPGFATAFYNQDKPLFVLHSIEMKNTPVGNGSLVFIVEVHSLYTEGIFLEQGQRKHIVDFLTEVSEKVDGLFGVECQILANRQWPFRNLATSFKTSKTHLSSFIDDEILEGYYCISQLVIEKIKRFLLDIKPNCEMNIAEIFIDWFLEFNRTPGPYCYPCFNQSPIDRMDIFKANRR